jgi:choline dehydrogenase-like flavoprotein
VLKHISSNDPNVDICLVGTGPVGIALALELERRGRDVLVLESGDDDVKPSEASRAEIVDPLRHVSMDLAVCRALGGTSWTWGGRCVPYDAVDWMQRDFVVEARWPIGPEELDRWNQRAAQILNCGDRFDIPYPSKLTDGLKLESVERWSRRSQLMLDYREHILSSERIRLSINATVIGMNFSTDGMRVESLDVSTPLGPRQVRARRFVLAMGGVETTRFLLNVQQKCPVHFGGIDGPLGRYYMGHISGKITDIVFDRPRDMEELDFKLDASAGAFYRRRFMLSAETQLRHRVLNTAFWPDNPAFYDPNHRSGVLSAVFLALAFPPTGRKLLPEGIRLAHTGPRPYPLGSHMRNAVLGAPRATADFYKILRDRFLRKPRKPGFLVTNSGGCYALHYHAEQVPNPNSRITLSGERDSFGVARARVDLRYCDQDIESVIDSHRLLDQALRANGIGRLRFMYPEEQLQDRVYSQAADGYHQAGSTRMGIDPRTSVVDSDLRVHGIANLFVASSSVFPSSGQANSTFLAVTFALRLAEHLDAEFDAQKADTTALSAGAISLLSTSAEFKRASTARVDSEE